MMNLDIRAVDYVARYTVLAAIIIFLWVMVYAVMRKGESGQEARSCAFAHSTVFLLSVMLAVPFIMYDRCQKAKYEPDMVYICTSPTATKYHLTDTCRGLRKCEYDIELAPLDSAKSCGYKSLCGFCRSSMK